MSTPPSSGGEITGLGRERVGHGREGAGADVAHRARAGGAPPGHHAVEVLPHRRDAHGRRGAADAVQPPRESTGRGRAPSRTSRSSRRGPPPPAPRPCPSSRCAGPPRPRPSGVGSPSRATGGSKVEPARRRASARDWPPIVSRKTTQAKELSYSTSRSGLSAGPAGTGPSASTLASAGTAEGVVPKTRRAKTRERPPACSPHVATATLSAATATRGRVAALSPAASAGSMSSGAGTAAHPVPLSRRTACHVGAPRVDHVGDPADPHVDVGVGDRARAVQRGGRPPRGRGGGAHDAVERAAVDEGDRHPAALGHRHHRLGGGARQASVDPLGRAPAPRREARDEDVVDAAVAAQVDQRAGGVAGEVHAPQALHVGAGPVEHLGEEGRVRGSGGQRQRGGGQRGQEGTASGHRGGGP